MSSSYALPGFPANPSWINNELCRDSSHDHLPEEAQSFVRRGCCLPQRNFGCHVNGKYVYRLQHRQGVPQHKVDEVNDVGLRIWKARNDDVAKKQVLEEKVELAEVAVKKESVEDESAKAEVTDDEANINYEELAGKYVDELETTKNEVTDGDLAIGKDDGEQTTQEHTENETISLNTAVAEKTTQMIKMVCALRIHHHCPQANRFQATDEIAAVRKESDEDSEEDSEEVSEEDSEEKGEEDSGDDEALSIEREAVLGDAFEVIEGGGPAEEMQVRRQNAGFLTRALRALHLI